MFGFLELFDATIPDSSLLPLPLAACPVPWRRLAFEPSAGRSPFRLFLLHPRARGLEGGVAPPRG